MNFLSENILSLQMFEFSRQKSQCVKTRKNVLYARKFKYLYFRLNFPKSAILKSETFRLILESFIIFRWNSKIIDPTK